MKQVLQLKIESDKITFDQMVSIKNAIDVAVNKALSDLFDQAPEGLLVEIKMDEVP